MNIDRYLVHEVQIERFLGTGAYGDTYDTATTERAWIDDSRQVVRGAGGDEEVSETTVSISLTAPDVPVDSKVTLPASFGSRTSQVIAVNRMDSSGLFGLEHIELSLK